MGHIWVLYGQKNLYGAHVGLEWDKCPDSAYMGPTYTCLLGYHYTDLVVVSSVDIKRLPVLSRCLQVDCVCPKCLEAQKDNKSTKQFFLKRDF